MKKEYSVYIAGPMSGLPDLNFWLFNQTAEHCRKRRIVVINPAETFGSRRDLPMAQYARYDISALLQVDGIVLLPGWQGSVGACTEVAIARWLGLDFFDQDLDHPIDPPLIGVFPQRVASS